jgi:hypothetical protein
MEQIVKVVTTVHVDFLVHATEQIDNDDMTRRIVTAMNREAAQFIVCADHDLVDFPAWIATISDLDVSIDRVRTIELDLDDA